MYESKLEMVNTRSVNELGKTVLLSSHAFECRRW